MKKMIVCTTINPPTPALKKFDAMKDWELVVVADMNTPSAPYLKQLKNSVFLSVHKQQNLYPKLSDMLGWRNVDRRNLGFLYAYQQGADVVAMVDDDNIPKRNWGKDIIVGAVNQLKCYECKQRIFDPLSVQEDKRLWHRGYPIEWVRERDNNPPSKKEMYETLVQANLWDDDPDVDAVCRMLHNPRVEYTGKEYYTSDVFSPFNMQNTLVHRKALPYMISIPFTGRMCDIWGAYYLQSVFPNCVAYGPSTVIHTQPRSWESIVKDMEEEVLGYQKTVQLIKDFEEYGPNAIFRHIPEKAARFIEEYQNHF